jgi:hypothetical protein
MKCRRVQPQLLDFSSGRLEAAAVRQVSAHLEECVDCRHALEHELRTAALLSSTAHVAPRVDSWLAIKRALEAARPVHPLRGYPRSRPNRWRPMAWAGGLAALMALLVTLKSPGSLRSTPPPETDLFRSFTPSAAAGLVQETASDPLVAAQGRVDRLLDRVADERS